jgi:hypothetical protein
MLFDQGKAPAVCKYVKRLSLPAHEKPPGAVKLLFAMALVLSRAADNCVR